MPINPRIRSLFHSIRPIRLDLYILTEVLGTFIGSCAFILFTLLMFQCFRLVDFFILHGAPLNMLLKMGFFMAISFLPIVLPLAFLISILIGFGRFSSDSELIAMKACGISMQRIAGSLMVPAILLAVLTYTLNVRWVPWGEVAFKRAEGKIGNTQAISAVNEGTFTTGFFDLLIFADKVDRRSNRMHRVFIFDEREQDNPLIYVAREAEIISIAEQKNLAASAMLQLFDGSLHHGDLKANSYEKMDYDVYRLYLKMQEGSEEGVYIRTQAIAQDELLKRIRESSPDEYGGREVRGEYWRRIAVGITPMIFVLMGIGFGTFRYRTAKAGAIVTGLCVVTLYWVLQLLATAALQKGSLSAPLAMEVPNIVMLALGIGSFWRTTW